MYPNEPISGAFAGCSNLFINSMNQGVHSLHCGNKNQDNSGTFCGNFTERETHDGFLKMGHVTDKSYLVQELGFYPSMFSTSSELHSVGQSMESSKDFRNYKKPYNPYEKCIQPPDSYKCDNVPAPKSSTTVADVPKQYSYSIKTPVHYFMVGVNAHAIFIGCRNPAQSPLYVKMCSNNTTLSAYSHSYVLEGGGYELESMIGELENSCSITAVAWYSSSRTRRYRSTDEEEIGEALAWGFELFWFRFNCTTEYCISDNNCFIDTDHSGAFITCRNYNNHRTPCGLLHRWNRHLDFNNPNYIISSPLVKSFPGLLALAFDGSVEVKGLGGMEGGSSASSI
nr:rust resistance kinase Lr10-like [Ipomoea batatas]